MRTTRSHIKYIYAEFQYTKNINKVSHNFQNQKKMENKKLLAENPGGRAIVGFVQWTRGLKRKRKTCLFDWDRDKAIYTEKNLNRGARTLYMYNGEAESCAKSIGRCTAMY